MYVKLSLRNLKRCVSDYAIYMFTLILSFSLIFAYNALIFYEPVRMLWKEADTLMVMLLFVTVVMVMILGWLVSYVVRFIFDQRSREFACYMTMGMERRQISRMFLGEQLILGFIAFLIGSVLGNFIFYGITQVIYKVFDTSFAMSLSYLLPALELSLGCYIVMFFVVLFFENRRLKKTTVTQLLDASKSNEKLPHLTKAGHQKNIVLFLLSAGIAIYLFYILYFKNMQSNAMAPVIMVIAGTMLFISIMVFYREAGYLIYQHYQKHPKKIMVKEKLFFYRQLTSRLSSNSRRLGVLSILGFIAIMALCGSYVPAGSAGEDIAANVPFELAIYERNEERLGHILDTKLYDQAIARYSSITDKCDYVLYELEDSYYMESNQITDPASIPFDDMAVTLSDYNKIRQVLGYAPMGLEPGTFMVHCKNAEKSRQVFGSVPDFTYNGQSYTLAACPDEYLSVSLFNGFGALLVLPDDALAGLKPERSCVIYQTKKALPLDFKETINRILAQQGAGNYHMGYTRMYLRADYIQETKTMYLFIILLCIYTAFICLFIIGTILSVQQLSESRKTVHQYRLMSFLGASRKDLQHGITGHLLIYFLLPLLLPVIYSAAFLAVIIHMGTFTGTSIRYGIGMSVLTLAVIYGVYFLVTNHQYQKYVLDTRRQSLSDLLEG